MFKNHLLVALRNLKRHRLYTFLNLAGLTIGFAGFLLIGIYVFDELQFDRMHQNADRIHLVVEEKVAASGRETFTAATSYNLAARSRTDVAEVEDVVKIAGFGRANIYEQDVNKGIYEPFLFGDASFGLVFDFKWTQGDPKTALEKPLSVVMTQTTARRVFGTEHAIGKTVIIDRFRDPMTVTGILEDFPKNSHLDFSLIISMSSLDGGEWYEGLKQQDWSSNYFTTYVLLQPDASAAVAEEKINALVQANLPDDVDYDAHYRLLALPDIHFHGAGIEGIGRTADRSYIWIFSAVALFLLGIACINYINLSTARAASRSKEVGVRKVVGAERWQLARQFLTETWVLTAMAALLAVGILQLVIPPFNNFADKALSLNFSTSIILWAGVVMAAILTGLFAGTYPALYLSRMKPVILFKSVFTGGKWEIPLRKMLVVVQFSLSVLMMIAAVVVWRQMRYLSGKDHGFNKEQLLVVDINSGNVRRGFETIKTAFSLIPAVKNVCVTSRVPGEWKVMPRVTVRTGGQSEDRTSLAWFIGADADFIETYEARLLQGRNFMADTPADSASVLLNETAAKALGIEQPSNQLIEIPSVAFIGEQEEMEEPFMARVIGIVQDFHFQSLREKIAPMIIANNNNPVHNIDYFTVRMATGNVGGTLNDLEAAVHSVDPGHLFEWHFLDDQWALFYEEDARREKIVTASALVAIIIACLGLFGLTTFIVEHKTKEIGVRKVLGASVASIVGLLSKEFIRLVTIALLVASPIAWLLLRAWLEDFAYRINIGWWVFALAGALALTIAFLTVGLQSMRAALSNPINSLRSE